MLETINAVARGQELPEGVDVRGSLTIPRRTKTGYLPQSVQVSFSGTVKEYLDFCAEEVSQVFNRYHELEEKLAKRTDNEVINEFGEILGKMADLNAWDLPKNRRLILEGLGLSDEYLSRNIKEISGGESTKVALAGILLSSPNLILLDEPTNNLDPRSLIFLENWIRNDISSLLLVSHDREFLDRTIDEIIEIDEATRKVLLFGGNYSFYFQKKKENYEAQLRQFEEQQRKRRQLEAEADRLRSEARRLESISTNAFYRAKGAGLARRARVQLERIERELTQIPKPEPPKKPTITVFETEVRQDLLVQAEDLSFSYTNNKKLLSEVSFIVHGGERIGIIGPNGSGKTTLLKLLLGEIQPTSGNVTLARSAVVGYLPQATTISNPKENVLDFIRKRASLSEDDAKTLLGKVLFTDPSHLRVGDFSAGELRRVELVGLFASKPNIIFLDEPTNHLDIYTIEMLEDALDNYKGGLIAVSHDERFLKNIRPNRIVIFEGEGNLVSRVVKKSDDVSKIFEEVFS